MADEHVPLFKQILRCEVPSEFHKGGHKFAPEGSLAAVMCKEAIRRELDDDDLEWTKELDDLVEFIQTRATKIFAIAVRYVGLEAPSLRKAMKLFQDGPNGGFTDDDLPVEPQEEDKPHILASFNGNSRRPIWNDFRIDCFCTHQWRFLAPIFHVATEHQYNHDFPGACILPFTKRYEAGSDRGAFGQVCKYGIHPNHLDDPEKSVRYQHVAVKEIQPRTERDRQAMVIGWEHEASVLQKMNALQQKHIVRFLTAFRHGDKGEEDHYLMFEWADGGNLLNLWKTLNRPLTPQLVKAVIKQLHGLANALCGAHYPEHGPKFRHGDLKPANILWFMSDDTSDEIGILKIADWGLAKEHNIVTELRTNKTSTEYGTRRYEPPEEETGLGVSVGALSPQGRPGERIGNRRSRLYDMWAMGCISLEFIIWLLHGLDGLRQFNDEVRSEYSEACPFYQTSNVRDIKVARVHDVAVEWMNHMANDARCQVGQSALGDLLELVQTRLLVVALPERLGTSQWPSPVEPGSGNYSGSPIAHDVPTSVSASLSPDTGIIHGLPTPLSPAPNRVLSPTAGAPRIVVSEVEFPPPRPRPMHPPSPESFHRTGRGRALATEFAMRMDEIYLADDNGSYWLPSGAGLPLPSRVGARDPEGDQTTRSIRVTPQSRPGSTRQHVVPTTMVPGGLALPSRERIDYGNSELDNNWDRIVDNEFATEAAPTPGRLTPFSSRLNAVTQTPKLCKICHTLREGLWKPAFGQTYQMSDLETASTAESCDMCRLIWRACERLHATEHSSVLIKREGSYLKLASVAEPALAILRDAGLKTPIDNLIQVGFPGAIPMAAADLQFEAIKQWLSHCDANHSCCKPASNTLSSTAPNRHHNLPTRLIEVGRPEDSDVRLIETQPADSGTWLALSHQWGPGPHFLTTTSNLASRLRGIALDALPATFRDAVRVTRAVGCPYLWIDSLCIVQGPDGDFNQEAKRMEHVYSGASCVLAVSRGTGHDSGFLQPRRERIYVTLQREGDTGEFYVCEHVDDFNAHVLEGNLSRRGWVLQERALARRTVFFTDWQMYWECGEGVRCETTVRMKNKLAAFLGDANFPQILMDARQGEKILRFQDLYKRYSRLEFTNAFDRPFAIDGLQSRILGALKSQGGFGILDEGPEKRGLLRRSLLWHRAIETPRLDRIVFPAARAISVVPSWSWMAYSGAIDYISPEFGSVEWGDMQSPWSGGGQIVMSEAQGGNIALLAQAWEYDPLKASPEDQKLILDTPGLSDQPKTLCVVLGRQAGLMQRAYLMIVRETTERGRDGSRVYDRVGAGYLPLSCLGEARGKVMIH